MSPWAYLVFAGCLSAVSWRISWSAEAHSRSWLEAAVTPLFLGLLWLRLGYLPAFPGSMGFWAPLLVMVLGMAAWPVFLAAEDGRAAGRALALGQAAWLGLALLLPVGPATIGGLNLLIWQVLIRQSLQRLLEAEGSSRPWSLLTGLLLLAGAPFSALFSAYFFILAPFMSVGDGVGTMHARLFSGNGMLAAVATLSVVYQTGALGYFYWTRVLQVERQAPAKGKSAWLLWIGAVLALWAGWERVRFNAVLKGLAVSAGASFQ